MDKRKVVEKFREHGLLLHPETLQKIKEKDMDQIIEQGKESNQLVVTPTQSSKTPEKTTERLSVEIRDVGKKKKITPKELSEFYRDRFHRLKKILSKKVDGVSINKLKNTHSQVSVIGMAKETTEKGFYLEDTTGRMEVISKEKPDPNDVVAVKGTSREDKFFTQEIIYPDVSLKREIGKIPGAMVLLSPQEPPQTQADLIFTPETEKKGEKRVCNFSNPAFAKITDGENTVNLLIYRPGRNMGGEEAKQCLRKRHLMPGKKEITGPEDRFTLEPAPDIFWLISGPKNKEIYKGVTLVFTEEEPALVDLGTKEVKFL